MTQQHAPYGGQAVIEGVMIRGQSSMATACRLPNREIRVHKETLRPLTTRHRLLSLPIIRGTPALIEALTIGFRSLMWSANQALEGEGQKPVSNLGYTLTISVALVFGIGFFILLPSLAVGRVTHHPFGKNLAEGMLRIAMFIGYVLVISRMRDIKRLFEYHGAEHKVVNAWEAGEPLELNRMTGYSVIHRRCGTSFILMVFAVSIVAHALLGWPAWHWRLLSRLALLPVIAGISYEIVRWSGRRPHSRLIAVLVAPGLWLQRMTTREPTEDQIEVAARAMREVLEAEAPAQLAADC